ncbi:MAG: hypothetical protein JWQ09_5808 [Segetibacter sp.]|nr:hypothetical protein [Segetibacter sp.]
MNSIENMFFPDLLNDLVGFSRSFFFERKVKRVYSKCLKCGHPILAQKIVDKYPHLIQVKSDLVMAMSMAMLASNSTGLSPIKQTNMKNIHSLDKAINIETQIYEAKIARIKRFYKFWDTMIVDGDIVPKFRIKGQIYRATNIDFMNYTLTIMPESIGAIIFMDFRK